jgi:hypothetical protein
MSGTAYSFQRDLLTALLHELNADLLGSELELLTAPDQAEFVAALRKTAAKLAAANAGWAAMVTTLSGH